MAAITIDIKGINETLAKFNKFEKNVKAGIKNEVASSVLNIYSDAKKLAPANLGTLRGSIFKDEVSKSENVFMFTVGAKASYAPYVEFGTGGKVSVPSGYADYAMQFKGKTGGKFIDMVKALAEWVSRKGITGTYSVKTQRRTGSMSTQGKQNMSTAYAIAISILRKGLRPQPFLIPAFEAEKPKLISKIQNVIKNAKS
jgi:HK97 gp10 family phage protein